MTRKILFTAVDVSSWNENIDFDKLKKNNIRGIIVRAGYGTEIDEFAETTIREALKREMLVGAYWAHYPILVEDYKKEAKALLNFLEKFKGKLELPIYSDFEYFSDEYLAENGEKWSTEQRTQFIKLFCLELEKNGYYVGVYANLDYIINRFNWKDLERFTLWYADWRENPDVEWISKAGIHQFTEEGDRYGDGIDTTDINNVYVDFPERIKNGGFNGFNKPNNTESESLKKEKKKTRKILLKINSTEDEFKKIISEFKERGFSTEIITDSTAKKVDVNKLVEDIALGQNGWFNVFGEERKMKIKELGLDFDIIQNKVDEYVEEHFE